MSGINIISPRVKNLLQGIEILDSQELDDFVQRLLKIRANKIAPSLNEKETELFQKINLGLSDEQRTEMNFLIIKRQQENISLSELDALIKLTTISEKLNVERIKALAQLSALRKISLPDLMEQLGIKPQTYV